MTNEAEVEPNSIPGARLLLDQMVRLNDNLLVSVDQLRQKSRAYLSVGALAVTAAAALLAISDVHPGLAWGAGIALLLFACSAACAVRAELAASLAAAPDVETFRGLVMDASSSWSSDQLALWAAREFADSVLPSAERTVDEIAQRVNYQLYLFLLEVVVLGGTLVAAVAT